MPRAFLVKKPCVSTCKRNWSELPDEERGEIYVPGEAAALRPGTPATASRLRAGAGRSAEPDGRRGVGSGAECGRGPGWVGPRLPTRGTGGGGGAGGRAPVGAGAAWWKRSRSQSIGGAEPLTPTP